MLATLLLLACQKNEPWARAVPIEALDEAIGGPKAMGREGDFLLENDRIRVVILGSRESLGPHTSGGSLVDADLQRNDPRYLHGHGNDLFSETFSTVSMNVARVDGGWGTVEVLNDGANGEAAVVRAEGPGEAFVTLLNALWLVLRQPDMAIRTDYILEPGVPAVRIRTTAMFGQTSFPAEEPEAQPAATSEEALDVLGLALEDGAAFGDFYLQGGASDVFTPGVGFDEDGYLHALEEQGINTFETPVVADFLAGTADGVSYALMPDEGRLFIPLFTSSQTAAFGAGQAGDGSDSRFSEDEAYYYDRWFAVGRGDVGSALDALLEARGDAVGRVSGHVIEAGSGTPLSDVRVLVFQAGAEAPWNAWTTDLGDDTLPDGSFSGTLPPGEYELMAHALGRPPGARVSVRVEADAEVSLTLESPRPGSVSFRVVDETGRQVPAKVTFFADDGQEVRRPDYGDGYIAGDPAQVMFCPHGEGEVVLPPGTYTAVASRGTEYDLGLSEPFTVSADTAIDLPALQVVHSVDTEGWVSADLHVHSMPSFDSGVSLPARVATMVAEGVEFMSSTDHDAITDFAPTIEDMGLEPWISSTVGVEVTTIEVGHYLGFPLAVDHLADQGGAFAWSDMVPQEIIDAIRAQGEPGLEPVVFVGHPRDGILGYFDQYGFDPYSGTPGSETSAPEVVAEPSLLVAVSGNDLITADAFTLDYDALEILNGKRFELIRTPTQAELDAYAADPSAVSIYDMLARTVEEQEALIAGDARFGWGHEGTVDDWFTLLNLGVIYTALGNSDTHGKTSVEAGCPRNYVVVGSDTPGQADGEEVAEAVRAGHVVASTGPFVRFWANEEDNGPGTTVVGETVTLGIEVQTPDWYGVDRVELYENGTLIADFTLDGDPALIVDISEQVDVRPDRDAWYVAIALGDDPLDPLFTPVEIPPIQLQDVVLGALDGVEAVANYLSPSVPIPRAFPVLPYALTNPIFVDVDADGWEAPGLPSWLAPPVDPTED